jgi:hypothetical protein
MKPEPAKDIFIKFVPMVNPGEVDKISHFLIPYVSKGTAKCFSDSRQFLLKRENSFIPPIASAAPIFPSHVDFDRGPFNFLIREILCSSWSGIAIWGSWLRRCKRITESRMLPQSIQCQAKKDSFTS